MRRLHKKYTDRQIAFAYEYLQDLNAMQAAQRAGYSKTTARSRSKEISSKVGALIRKLNKKRMKKLEINAEWVLKRAVLLADFNIKKFLKKDDEGTMVYDFSRATDDDWYCISEYSTAKANLSDLENVPMGSIRLKHFDKLKALELVGKHVNVNAFKETHQITADMDNQVIVEFVEPIQEC